MSVESTTWVYAHSTSSGVARGVLLVIADTVNHRHGYRFWMTRAEVANRAGWSTRSIDNALTALVEAGELERTSSGRPGRAAEYTFPRPILSMFSLYRLTNTQRAQDVRASSGQHAHETPEHAHDMRALPAGDAHLTTTEHKPTSEGIPPTSEAIPRKESAALARALRAAM